MIRHLQSPALALLLVGLLLSAQQPAKADGVFFVSALDPSSAMFVASTSGTHRLTIIGGSYWFAPPGNPYYVGWMTLMDALARAGKNGTNARRPVFATSL